MAGFRNVRALVDSAEAGATTFGMWRKSPSQVTTTRLWFDLSMSPGNPIPQYYAATPLTSALLRQSVDGGIYHGGNVSPAQKMVRVTTTLATVATGLPMPMILLDYLMFYPFIDEGAEVNDLINSAALTRYTDGEGCKLMAVSVAGRTGGQSFYCTYTNSEGVAGRVTQTVIENTAPANGTIVTSDGASASARGPFIPLQAGDTGVQSVQSVTMLGADVGLFALVIVKPILQTQVRGIDAPVENDFLIHRAQLPVIADDAYLNFICLPQGSLAATALHGYIETTWN